MGYLMLMGACFACRRPFMCNPHTVPSYDGEPICRDCIERVNAKRRLTGRPLWPVAPDAYEAAEC